MSRTDELITGYRNEKDRYLQVLQLACELKESLENGSPMQVIIGILKKKSSLMEEIEAIDRDIDREKKEYMIAGSRSSVVATLIEELSGIMEKILSTERENEILFSSSSRRMRSRVVADQSREAERNYAFGRYSSVISGEII